MSLGNNENMNEPTTLSIIMPEESKGKLGAQIILPKSFIGDPRYMHRQYLNATNNIPIQISDRNWNDNNTNDETNKGIIKKTTN